MKLKTPRVNISKWNAILAEDEQFWHSYILSCPVFREEPCVVVEDSRNNARRLLIRFFEQRFQIILGFYPYPDRSNPPELVIHMPKSRNPDTGWVFEKVSAAVLACLAMRAEKPRLSVQRSEHNVWLRKMYEKCVRNRRRYGPLKNCPNVVKGVMDLCYTRWRSICRTDIGESLDRIHDEFEFLTNYVEEDKIMCMWREIQVRKVIEM